MKVVTASQMASIEQASERAGVGADALMENAGLSVAQAARDELGGAAGARVVVLAGPGNNGADGLVAARHLRRWGAEVVCCLLTRRPEFDPKLALARRYGVEIVSNPKAETLRGLVRRSRLVIDSVLGTGRSRPLAGPMRDAMLLLLQAREFARPPTLLALDLPTGLNADTGEADPACPPFDATLTLGYPKIGLLRFPGSGLAGRLQILDIGIPPGLPEERSVNVEMLTRQWIASRLPPRPLDSHKGTYGHALVIAGSRQYTGAAWLASQASVRSGAGLTTLASPKGVYPIAASRGAEAIHLPLAEDADGRIAPDAADAVRHSKRRFTAVLAGCGMGQSEGTTEFLRRLLNETQGRLAGLPVVIDADGLNNLSRIPQWRSLTANPLLLTPHPGEMATLTGLSVAEIQAVRESSAREWAERWSATLALKGAHTVVASPGEPVRIAPFANPGLSTGGTGDVLSGVIVSLLAQGAPPPEAAAVGVYLHSYAAGIVTGRNGQAGLAASDLLDALPLATASLSRATLVQSWP